nr:DUF262 domain-containing protein [Neosynechococcus sphagnicola]
MAEVTTEKGKKLEIIDGMQRLNAITSFIDQEFDINGTYFDLDTMADTKLLKDRELIIQKPKILDRKVCADIVRYQIPLSVFQELGTGHTDEVFRRLNSGGRQLSKQELRQAGATSRFASIVRKLASNIRGDSSVSDILDLNSMKNISITNRNLDYGIPVESIFWVKNNIITKEALRQSQDEEIIADIIAWVALDKGIRSSSEILNQLYSYQDYESDETEVALAKTVEIQIQKINEDILISNIQFVLDKLIEIINKSGKTFNSLLFESQQAKISRYFQIVFLALYKMLVEENCEIINEKELIGHLNKAGDKVIKLAAGGGNWSAKEKQTQMDALCGVIKSCFVKKTENDPARNQWITRFENILMQSSTEQALYDFKVGLHPLDVTENTLNRSVFSKIIKTLTAMANTFPRSTGYCLLGVADNKITAEKHKEVYGLNYISYANFFVTGIDAEARSYHSDVDKYFTKITQLVAQEPLNERDKDHISRNILTVNYFDKTVIMLKIESGNNPSVYDGKYYSHSHSSGIQS